MKKVAITHLQEKRGLLGAVCEECNAKKGGDLERILYVELDFSDYTIK